MTPVAVGEPVGTTPNQSDEPVRWASEIESHGFTPTPGLAVGWFVDPSWRLATTAERSNRLCRRPGCPCRPAAALLRRHGSGTAWWLYCHYHLYGRSIEHGLVLSRRLVPDSR